MPTFQIDFEPIGTRVDVSSDTSLLSAAQSVGIDLTAVCGGVGVCGTCKVHLMTGELSAPTTSETDIFSPEEIKGGWRLACQAYPRSECKIEVPPESMTTLQRLQMEGSHRSVELSPGVRTTPVSFSPPSLEDLRADWERFADSLPVSEPERHLLELPVLFQFSTLMRQEAWSGQAVFGSDNHIIGFLPSGKVVFGVAIDIGTTKMAAFIVDLQSGEVLGKKGAMNPQIAFGEDVVARIAYANQGEPERLTLQQRVVETLNTIMRELCDSINAEITQVVDLVIVGNTAIHHLLAGLSVRQLGQAPYVAAVKQALQFPARYIGLKASPGARVYLPPNVAGFVGGDHIAMILASGLTNMPGIGLALDIGTNTEISLSHEGVLVSCSCASGPAFEGAHIHAGMRAVSGAIERAQFFDGQWHLATIDGKAPIGLCGSGILDVVAELLKSGQIDSAGRFTDKAVKYITHAKGGAIQLVPADRSGTGQTILVTRDDIREIQLAKAAIRAGIEALLMNTGLRAEEIDHFIVAGAFGTYLNLESAIRIGMFPSLPRKRYQQIGNAAGAGAQMMLISEPSRREAEAILSKMTYIELTTEQGFMESYVDAISFDG